MIVRRLLPAAFLVLAGACSCRGAEPSPAAPPAAAADRPNAILISWDGLSRDVVRELLKDKKLPNLAKLVEAGSFQEITVKGHETETRPGHAEMLTALSADATGVRSNYEGGPVPEGTVIFDRLKAALGKDAVATIVVTGKAYVGSLVPDGSRKALDLFDAGSRGAATVGPLALGALEKNKARRFAAFFHFLDPDSAGHGYGRDSAQYRQAAVTCDAWLGAIADWLKKEKLDGSTLIYVMADHGMDPGGHQHHNAPDSWLATNDKTVIRGGTIADVPATLLARMGVDLKTLKPELLGKPLVGKPAAEPAPAGERKTPAPVSTP
ncbi:MAG TPA: alkaline phosphatase family protein [Planctomycetota bacterium]|nr:alkaline phosphatase family protein [Planctomycetota bacterium]